MDTARERAIGEIGLDAVLRLEKAGLRVEWSPVFCMACGEINTCESQGSGVAGCVPALRALKVEGVE